MTSPTSVTLDPEPSSNSTAPASPVPPDLLECDIVMTGGITSGVVCPLAVVELSKTYRSRNIGGTSAGAIATAAAELGRDPKKHKDSTYSRN